MNTLLLNFSTINGEKIILPCQTIEVYEPVMVVKSLLGEKSKILLLEVKHLQINTLLDLTNVIPYELWYFDQEKNFTAKAFSFQNKNQLFQIQTQARYIALIPGENDRVTISKLLINFRCHSFNISFEESDAFKRVIKLI